MISDANYKIGEQMDFSAWKLVLQSGTRHW